MLYILKTKYGLAYKKIGGLFGNRDHSTVINGVEKIESEIKTNNDINTIKIPILQRRKVAIVVVQLFAENQTQVSFIPFHFLLNPTFGLILLVSQGLVNNR